MITLQAFVEHGIDPLSKSPDALPLDPAHLGVVLALAGLLQWQELSEVRPRQLLRQCGNNRVVRKRAEKAAMRVSAVYVNPRP